MKNRTTVVNCMTQNCFMASIDLQDGYLNVSICKADRIYLRFTFNNIVYEYKALPFGLALGPWLFTKLKRTIITYLRKKGFVSVIYLDDILLFGATYEECLLNVQVTSDLLQSLGFLINIPKSNLTPSNKCKFLGFVFDSISMSIELPLEKRHKIINLVRRFKQIQSCRIRDFAEMLGYLVSVCPAVNYSWLYTKRFEREKFLALRKQNGNYDSLMVISHKLAEDFNWWENNILTLNYPINKFSFAVEIVSDASLTGWGIVCGDKRSHGEWTNSESEYHIKYLELLAAFFGFKHFAKDTRNKEILLRIDNTTAISYINRMSGIKFPHLNDLSRLIWQWCKARNLFIFASYISSSDKQRADCESRRSNEETE